MKVNQNMKKVIDKVMNGVIIQIKKIKIKKFKIIYLKVNYVKKIKTHLKSISKALKIIHFNNIMINKIYK